MPNGYPMQVVAYWRVELGNRNKFLFDISQGSASRNLVMKILMDCLDKVFIRHLHEMAGGT